MICIIKWFHSLLGRLKLVFDCFSIVFIRCVTLVTLVITLCYIFEWSLLFVHLQVITLSYVNNCVIINLQLQVTTLSYINNCVIINLSFLFLVAIIYKDRKRYFCYIEDIWMCYQEQLLENLVYICFTNNIWNQIKNTYLKI